jgi:hypothetical protein
MFLNVDLHSGHLLLSFLTYSKQFKHTKCEQLSYS